MISPMSLEPMDSPLGRFFAGPSSFFLRHGKPRSP